MEKLKWIRDLVRAEQQMEETGQIDFSAGFDPHLMVEEATYEYLMDLKTSFGEVSAAFNELKGSAVGNLKIYGISKTKADFMLFRNGYKLIFSYKCPGAIAITYNAIGANFIPGAEETDPAEKNTEYLKSRWGAFGELQWTYKDQQVNMDNLVRFYLSKFIKESAK